MYEVNGWPSMEMSTRRAGSLTVTEIRSEPRGPAEARDTRMAAAAARMSDTPPKRMRMISRGLQRGSNLFCHNIRCAIAATQKTGGLLIANDLLLRGIETDRPAQAVGSIGQVHQRRRDVGFLNRRMNILGAAAANALDEVCVVVA